jgi:hypothetical protein
VSNVGTISGLIRDIPSCKELIEGIVRQAEAIITGRLAALAG